MDRLEAMSIVLAVAELGSLSAAARRLNTPIATASRQIAELETHLRTKLFDRSTRKLVLTDAGSTYVAALKRILADLSEAERAASGEYTTPTGELVVTAPVGLGRVHLMPILAEFLRSYPDINVRLVLGDRILSLSEEHVDVALRIGELPDSRLIALRVGATHPVVCASPAYLAARGTPRTPDDIAGHDCIIYEGFRSPDLWAFAHQQTDIAITVQPRLVVSSAEAACDAARAGIGLARAFSYHVVRSIETGTLSTVLDEYRPAALPVSLVYRAGRFLPIKLRAFLDFASPRLKARLAT
ncbi:LysR family transcriptional regulator [Vineibacter terrae]|uniref:LysR family transcriptional regulator n=1 Tax=Vineibacter terrae TaxID=2586908 RepID=A0A5C8P7Y5_9HYPH|nr:LysR substrate-binding domain-containing protein [Vineibacter terrae]TXL69556.1 LysR family transcriptional regulator [Vineibacter terrae]